MNLSEETVKDIMSRVIEIVEGKYVDNKGNTQLTLNLGVNNGLDGRNIQQEEHAAKEATKVKKSTPKNPNRVVGGKKSHATKLANRTKEFYSRPIFKELGYTGD